MAKNKTTREPDMLSRLGSDIVLALRLFIDRRVSLGAKLIPALMVIYMLSPLDFVPDLLLPFGVVDDLGVFLLGIQWFIHSAPGVVVDEYRGLHSRSAPGTRRGSDGTLPPVINGRYQVRDDLDDGWDDYSDYEDEDSASSSTYSEKPKRS